MKLHRGIFMFKCFEMVKLVYNVQTDDSGKDVI